MKKRPVYLSAIIAILLTSFFMSGCMLPFLGNEPVTIVSKANLSAIVGKLYKYQLDIEDDSKTKVVYTLDVAPEGMTMEGSTGLIMWTPKANQVGKHEVVIRVSDGWFRDEQKFTITVTQFQLKSISIKPTTMSFPSIPSSKNIESITAKYNDGSSKDIEKAKCEFKSNDPSVATVDEAGKVTSKKKGNTIITVSYTEEGITQSTNINITVTIDTDSSGGGG
ncbi:MAG TPA: putative Ig domain-containing protein [Atribacterota bacterium]|nr:putative Ig domain-containing protein [Atribacterota bacterium]